MLIASANTNQPVFTVTSANDDEIFTRHSQSRSLQRRGDTVLNSRASAKLAMWLLAEVIVVMIEATSDADHTRADANTV